MRPRAIAWTLAVLLVLGGVAYGAWRGYDWVTSQVVRERCWVPVEGADDLALTWEQSRNAAIITAVSYQQGLSEQAAVIALATAWQESGLRNINYGDRDSLGLFQQRPSYGWGTEEEIMDPWYSSRRFYEELVKFPDWETTDVNDIAQKVQRSGHPEAYRKHETNARALAGALRGSAPESLGCVDRDDVPGNPHAFEQVVAQVPGVTSAVEGTVATLTSADPAALWAATHLALANTREAGIVSATIGDRAWVQSRNRGQWGDASEPVPQGTAVIELRG